MSVRHRSTVRGHDIGVVDGAEGPVLRGHDVGPLGPAVDLGCMAWTQEGWRYPKGVITYPSGTPTGRFRFFPAGICFPAWTPRS
jgi:hypothetical protein